MLQVHASTAILVEKLPQCFVLRRSRVTILVYFCVLNKWLHSVLLLLLLAKSTKKSSPLRICSSYLKSKKMTAECKHKRQAVWDVWQKRECKDFQSPRPENKTLYSTIQVMHREKGLTTIGPVSTYSKYVHTFLILKKNSKPTTKMRRARGYENYHQY